ncbi:MAG: hypothetical protein K8E24_002655, partial [Methanobacterium paludis]|nr:hypothetical protein [Methanobacterium paludis]
MKDILKDFEQLKEAYNQLSKNTVTNARLALILLDNLAEIQMYRPITSFLGQWEFGSSIEPLEYSPNKIRKIEESFKEKVNFLVKHDVINDPYGDIKTT